jgi:hypothetical protein
MAGVAAIILAALAAPTAALASHPTILQKFAADSGDTCRYGYTEGRLSWRAVHPPEPVAVDVAGKLVDRPTALDPVVCPDDRMYSIANFTASASGVVVDRHSERADNNVVQFVFVLGNSSTIARIDTVTVQVCRLGVLTPGYCGRAQIFHPVS